MKTKNNNVAKKNKYKYSSPSSNIARNSRDGSIFAIFFYIIIELVYFLYYLYKISPIYIKILFWLIILGLCIWLIIRSLKKTNDSTPTTPNN